MADASPATVRVSRRFPTPAEQVFDAWLNPESARKWLFATPTGQITRCEIDARPGGGKFLILRRDDDSNEVEHLGEYLEIARPTRLVFTFSVPKYSSHITRVTIHIAPLAAGCELILLHENVLPEWIGATEHGWNMILQGLEDRS